LETVEGADVEKTVDAEAGTVEVFAR